MARQHSGQPAAAGVAGEPAGAVVVGVHPAQSVAVVQEAARLANELGRPLLCGYVTEDSYLTEWDRDEVRDEASLHPGDLASDDDAVAFELADALTEALEDQAVEQGWSLRVLAGDPSRALSRLADEVQARLIVVGTHQHGISHAVEEWLAGSVATRLGHDQARTIVLVPVTRDTAARLLRSGN